MRIQFPKDKRNDIFDGQVHNITPQEIASILIGNNKLYVLTYIENNLYGTTLLAQNKEGKFFKVPLDDYKYLDEFLNNAYTNKDGAYIQQESLSILDNQEFIGTVEVQNAEQLFSNPNIRKEPIRPNTVAESQLPPRNPNIAVAGNVPPVPPIAVAGNVPPVPPRWDISSSESKPPKAFANPIVPPNNDSNEDKLSSHDEKHIKLYVGVYNGEYAIYRNVPRNNLDEEKNRFRFYRAPYNRQLDLSISLRVRAYLFAQENGMDAKYSTKEIDYGVNGENVYNIIGDLINLTDEVSDLDSGKIRGKRRYGVHIETFSNKDDFKKFKSSTEFECYPESDLIVTNNDVLFEYVASSKVPVTFKDSTYRTKLENSYSEQLSIETHKKR